MMTRKQCQQAVGLISRITRLGYSLSIDEHEVTVFDGIGQRHSHHGGATFLQRMEKAWISAQEYEADYAASSSKSLEGK